MKLRQHYEKPSERRERADGISRARKLARIIHDGFENGWRV